MNKSEISEIVRTIPESAGCKMFTSLTRTGKIKFRLIKSESGEWFETTDRSEVVQTEEQILAQIAYLQSKINAIKE